MAGTLRSTTISTKLQRIAKLAKDAPDMAFTTLAHHIDLEWLEEAFRRTRKNTAPGVDGQSAQEYAANLEVNLRSLLDRAKTGSYRAPPVRRVHIPKAGRSETRPIGIPTIEDRILQRAVAMVIEAIFEQDFLPCSYGFRPGRSAHDLLAELQRDLVWQAGGWVIELDIRKFYDTLDHEHLRAFLHRRVRDGVLVRLIGKWLRAGVLEDCQRSATTEGTPQGGVISPLLSNVYLHEVLDSWFERDVRPRLRGSARLYRYADDAVLVFAKEEDARRVLAVLPKRFEKYGLSLHPEKTRLLDFRRPGRPDAGRDRVTFDLLGFTHFWAKTRSGKMIVKRRTARDRLRRSLKAVSTWCRFHRHRSVKEQQHALTLKLRGHYNYFGITGNYEPLFQFYREVRSVWRKWLGRRSNNAPMGPEKMQVLLQRYPLPLPRIARPYSETQQNHVSKSRMR